jgi:hypothetical protein
MNNVEVDQQSNPMLAQLQIPEQLCLVKGKESGDRLQFDDDCILDEQVYSISRLDLHVSVDDREWPLLFDSQALVLEFIAKATRYVPSRSPGPRAE